MKRYKYLSAFAVVVASTANAQSSVTLYGIVDEGFLYTSNVKGLSQYSLKSGVQKGSRFGLLGDEDLGGRTKAVFRLEGGFNASTGAINNGGALFGRTAYVGLSNDTFGTVTFGRQYQATDSVITGILLLPAGSTWAAAGGGYGTHIWDIDNLDGANIFNNTIKYQSPTIGGVTAVGFYSVGGKPGSISQNSIYDFAIGYQNGPFSLGAGYLFAKDPNFSVYGTNPSASATGNNMPSVAYSGYASASSDQIIVAGAGYKIGPARVTLVYSNVQFGGLGSVGGVSSALTSKYRGSADFNTGEIGLTYQVTPALFVGVDYSFTKDSGANNSEGAKYHNFITGAIYSLSKATSLYAFTAYQRASGTNSLGKPAVAQIGGLASPSSNGHQLVATVGITHRF